MQNVNMICHHCTHPSSSSSTMEWWNGHHGYQSTNSTPMNAETPPERSIPTPKLTNPGGSVNPGNSMTSPRQFVCTPVEEHRVHENGSNNGGSMAPSTSTTGGGSSSSYSSYGESPSDGSNSQAIVVYSSNATTPNQNILYSCSAAVYANEGNELYVPQHNTGGNPSSFYSTGSNACENGNVGYHNQDGSIYMVPSSGGNTMNDPAINNYDVTPNISNNKIPKITIQWLLGNYETAEGVSLPRSMLYNHYLGHCNDQNLDPVNAASFGKLIRAVFVGLRTRRLGTRGNSKYHYYGIRIKTSSPLYMLEHGQSSAEPIYHHGHHIAYGHYYSHAHPPTVVKNKSINAINSLTVNFGNGSTSATTSLNIRSSYTASGSSTPGPNKIAGSINNPIEPHPMMINAPGNNNTNNNNNNSPNNNISITETPIIQPKKAKVVVKTEPGHPTEYQPGPHVFDRSAYIKSFLGDISGALTEFPDVATLSEDLRGGLKDDDVSKFRNVYRAHCEHILVSLSNFHLNQIEIHWRSFWTKGEYLFNESDKILSKETVMEVCKIKEVQHFIREADFHLYQAILDLLIPDVLQPVPSGMTQAIRNFAKGLETCLTSILSGYPEEMFTMKLSVIRALCQTLRRYTSLNHLAQAARAVLQNHSQVVQMLSDLNRVDFHGIEEQATWVCGYKNIFTNFEMDFKTILSKHQGLEDWAQWLNTVVEKFLHCQDTPEEFTRCARQFLLNWSFYSSLVIRDLTLRSASSFGSFHLLRLLYDEYLFYLVEHKVARVTGQIPLAIIWNGY